MSSLVLFLMWLVPIQTVADEVSTLQAIADTVIYHSKSISALGAYSTLSQELFKQYSVCIVGKPPDTLLVISLLEVCRMAPIISQNIIAHLNRDLVVCNQTLAGDVCSPASDNMTNALLNQDDEIEQMLNSGNRMDEQTFSRIFTRIMTRLNQDAHEGLDKIENTARWLIILRRFELKWFEFSMSSWLSSSLSSGWSYSLKAKIAVLTGCGCLPLGVFLRSAVNIIQKIDERNSRSATEITLCALSTLFVPPNQSELLENQVSALIQQHCTSRC